jgi:hypothetical protein
MASFTGISGNGSFSQDFTEFNPADGTLTSVTVELVGLTLNGTASGTNTGSGPEDITLHLGGTVLVTTQGVGITGTNAASTGMTIQDSVFPANGATNVPVSGSTGTFTYTNNAAAVTGGSNVGTISSPPTDLTAYTSSPSGSITVKVTGQGIQVIGGATSDSGTSTVGVSLQGFANVSGTVELIYNYTAVPEPSKTTACMIGLALCILVGRNYFKGRGLSLV